MKNAPKPLNDSVLVELKDALEHIDTPDKQFATKTSGIVQAVADKMNDFLIGKKVYFEDYKDGVQVEIEGKKYAFIKYKEIRGYDE